jgi:predicted RNA binding protein YcfA (HicA-like mRNA interferase family)
MSSYELIRLLQKDGWIKENQKGSHAQFVHPVKKGKVTVPVHGKKDIPIGTLKAIMKQAGLK